MIMEKVEGYKKARKEEEAREKIEFELYKEMMEEKGLSQRDRINNSLEEFGQIDDVAQVTSTFEKIMMEMKG
jgi:hypothetical protein